MLQKLGDDNVSSTVKAKVTTPPYQTEPTIGELAPNERGQPEMVFSPGAPHNPSQPTIPLE